MASIKMHVSGVSVQMSVGAAKVVYIGGEPYTGEYSVIPKADAETVLDTAGKLLTDNVCVRKIPYYETSNNSDGFTVYIGSEV